MLVWQPVCQQKCLHRSAWLLGPQRRAGSGVGSLDEQDAMALLGWLVKQSVPTLGEGGVAD